MYVTRPGLFPVCPRAERLAINSNPPLEERERQKVTVKKVGKRLVVEDWQKKGSRKSLRV